MAEMPVLTVNKIILVLLLQASFAHCIFLTGIFKVLGALLNCDYDEYNDDYFDTTVKPTTAPTTAKPTTEPTTVKPTTESTTTVKPTTESTTTVKPTTESTTTVKPTTESTTTVKPTTESTTVKSTTIKPPRYAPLSESLVLTWPGTKWCGPGNLAMSYSDLGEKRETDRCCRAHDHCDDEIRPGYSAHGLVNDGFFTRLDCRCEDEFRRCLRESRDGLGDTIGSIYFNAVRTVCFRLDYPIIRCRKYAGKMRRKCAEYEFDFGGDKMYQWFDLPQY